MPEETEKILQQVENDVQDKVTPVETPQEQPIKLGYSSMGRLQDHKCLICGKMTCGGSIASHLTIHSKGRHYGTTYIKYGEDGMIIKKPERAAYGTVGGSKKQYPKKNRPAKCLVCDWTGTESNIYYHLSHSHQVKQIQGQTYEIIGEENIPVRQKSTKPQIQLDVKSSAVTMNELQMPLTITIPIIIGKIRIE
jgi:hypothetical protein